MNTTDKSKREILAAAPAPEPVAWMLTHTQGALAGCRIAYEQKHDAIADYNVHAGSVMMPLYATTPPDLSARVAELESAARAVVERWDTPLWKDVPATAEYINALRRALEAQ